MRKDVDISISGWYKTYIISPEKNGLTAISDTLAAVAQKRKNRGTKLERDQDYSHWKVRWPGLEV